MSADIAANEIYKLRNEIARLKGQTNWVCSCGGTDCKGQQENADLRDTLDAVIAADGRAVDLWRAAHPGKELVIPDRAKLVGWLLDQNAALRAAAVEVCAVARVWATVWGDKLSTESIQRLAELEKQILKEAQP